MHTSKSRLTSEVGHELLSPQPQQAMGPLAAGRESRSFSSETWNTEIPAASPRSEPVPAWSRQQSYQLPAPALPGRYLCATESFIFLQVKFLTAILFLM